MQKLGLGIAALFILLLIIGLALPSQSRFVVSETIHAHPATVFALINDPRRAALWSPVTASDPEVRSTYAGPRRGRGASTEWHSPIAGSGTQTIVDSQPYRYIETMINEGEPGEARTWFELQQTTGTTTVHWGFEHDYGLNIVGRFFGAMATGVIRRDYQAGLSTLKELAESLPAADFGDLELEHLNVDPVPIAYLSTTSAPDSQATSAALRAAYVDILAFIEQNQLATAGPPLSISRAFVGSKRRLDAAIPRSGINDRTPSSDGDIRIGQSYGGAVLRVAYRGNYAQLQQTHRKIVAYLAALGIERNGDPWESYVDDQALLTYVYYPVSGD